MDVLPTPEQMMLDIPVAGRIQDTSAFKDVRRLNDYLFMQHTFDGSHGYKDCSYLVPNDRETFYDTRRRSSYYINVFKPILNAMVDPCFNGDISRETNNDMMVEFIQNCDNSGTDLSTFMKAAIKNARLYSINFIVMDNFKSEEISAAETTADAIEDRKFPYIYERPPQSIKEYHCDEFGKMIDVTFFDKEEHVKGADDNIECRSHYRYWDTMNWRAFYTVAGKNTDEGKAIEITTGEGVHGLGKLPVIAFIDFSKSANLSELPSPEMYDLAFLCFALFNKESHVVQMELYQTFSILCTSGLGKSAISLGVSTLLDSGTESKYPPTYVSPSQEGIKVLVENCTRLKEEIQAEAQQKGVIGVKSSKSGVATQWDFRAEEAVLRQTSVACMRVENAIAELFGIYLGTKIAYEVKYPLTFSPVADGDELTRIMALLDKMPPKEIELELWKRVVEIQFKGNQEKIEEIKDSVDVSAEQSTAINAMKIADDAEAAVAPGVEKEIE